MKSTKDLVVGCSLPNCGSGDSFVTELSGITIFTADDGWAFHFVVADVESDGAGHEEVVVRSDDGTEGSVGLSLVDQHLVEGTLVALNVGRFAYDLDEGGDDFGLCGHVGVESPFAWHTLAYFVIGLWTGIEVGVDSYNLTEDVKGLVTVDHSGAVVGFEGVAFDDQQGVVVEGSYLGGFPRK